MNVRSQLDYPNGKAPLPISISSTRNTKSIQMHFVIMRREIIYISNTENETRNGAFDAYKRSGAARVPESEGGQNGL